MRKASIALYYWGLVIGLFFLSVLLWGSIESSVYFEVDRSNKGLAGLWCPYFMHPDEVLEIHAPINNPTNQVMNSISYVDITTKVSSLMRTEKIVVDVPANARSTADWSISTEDKLFGTIILMRIIQYNNVGIPTYHAFCSVIVADVLGLSGKMLLTVFGSVSLFFMTLGLVFPYFSMGRTDGRATPDNILFRQMSMATLGIVVGVFLTLWGYWIPAFFDMILMMFLGLAIFKEIVLQEKQEQRLSVELGD